jgi:hypothetical protein
MVSVVVSIACGMAPYFEQQSRQIAWALKEMSA